MNVKPLGQNDSLPIVSLGDLLNSSCPVIWILRKQWMSELCKYSG